MKQLTLNWNPVHDRENNPHSQQHLELKRDDFSEQCWEALKRMLNGERLTMKIAINTGISDIRRRAKDLIDHKGIPVKREWDTINGIRQDYKVYYISPIDREPIMKRLIDLMNIEK